MLSADIFGHAIHVANMVFGTLTKGFGGEMPISTLPIRKLTGRIAIGVVAMDGFMRHLSAF